VIYDYQKLDRFAESENLGRLHLWHKSGFWRNFVMTSSETLYTKNVVNELSFPLVTHMTCFDTRFGRYRFLKSGYSADHILDRLGIQVLDQVFGPQEMQNLLGFEYKLCR
jgi:hypothetical protein